MKGFLTNTASNLGLRGATIAINLFLVPFLIATLGTAHYGLLILAKSIVGNFAFLEAGLSSGIARFTAKYTARNDTKSLFAVLSNSLSMYLIVALFNTIVLLALYYFDASSLFNVAQEDIALFEKLLLVGAVTAFGQWASRVFWGGLIGLKYHYLTNLINFTNLVLSGVGTVVLALMGKGIFWIFCFQQGLTIALLPLYVWFMYRKSGWLPKFSFHKKVLKEIYGFSLWAFLYNLSNQIILQIDTLLVSIYLNPSALVVYNIFNILFLNLNNIPRLAISAFPPYLITIFEKEGIEKLRSFGYRISRYANIVHILVFLPAILFVAPFIRLWVGEEYVNYVALAQIAFALLFLSKLNSLTYHLALSTGKIRIFSLIAICAALVNIPITIYMIDTFEGIGANIATGIIYLSAALANFMIIFKVIGMRLGRFVVKSIIPSILAGLVWFGICFFFVGDYLSTINSWWELTISTLVFIAGLSVLAYLTALSHKDRNALANFKKLPAPLKTIFAKAAKWRNSR